MDMGRVAGKGITEGSTIIESKVALTSDSDSKSVAATKAKASAMNEKLEAAAASTGLELDGIAVLNSKFSVVEPDDDEGNIEVAKSTALSSSSSSNIVVIIVAVAVAVVALAIGAFAFYKLKLRRKQPVVRAQQYTVGEIEEKKKDEEMGILADNSRMQPNETIDNGLKFPGHLEQDQNFARIEARAQAQEKLSTQMRRKAHEVNREVDEVAQKPLSINEIMKGIE